MTFDVYERRAEMERRGRAVLVAVDLSTHHGDAILAALDLEGGNLYSAIHLLNVQDPGELLDVPEKRILTQEEEYLAETPAMLLQRARTLISAHGRPEPRAKLLAHARIGPVIPTVLQACVDHDADLLVCATRGRTGLTRVLQGSIAEALVRAARCPVLVARRKSYRGISPTQRPDAPPAAGETPPRVVAPETESRVASTTLSSWEPSDNGPTGFRIV